MKKLALLTTALLPTLSIAEEVATEAASGGSSGNVAFAKALCIAVPASIVGFSQSRAASAALEGIGRNPAAGGPLFTPLLLSLALMESLVLFAFAIAFMIT